ncbi:MAG: hypothetical protein FJ395_19120 [Verrucomicrobia bacterium]|nr:hypothetical protein [Verrucomicrobiota bacterium]
MKITVLLFLFCATVMRAGSSMPADEVKQAEAFASETIPVFELKNATFEDALATVRRAWEQRHPEKSFPVLVTDYQPPDENRAANPARMTMSLKNVPFIKVLQYIGSCSGRRLIPRGQFFQMESHPWIEEDWVYRSQDVTVELLAHLFHRTKGCDGFSI